MRARKFCIGQHFDLHQVWMLDDSELMRIWQNLTWSQREAPPSSILSYSSSNFFHLYFLGSLSKTKAKLPHKCKGGWEAEFNKKTSKVIKEIFWSKTHFDLPQQGKSTRLNNEIKMMARFHFAVSGLAIDRWSKPVQYFQFEIWLASQTHWILLSKLWRHLSWRSRCLVNTHILQTQLVAY